MVVPILVLRQLAEPHCFLEPLLVDFLHPLHHFKQPGAATDAVGLKGRRDRQTDGFLRPGGIRNNKVCG